MRRTTHAVGFEQPISIAGACGVPGCDGGPLVAVASDGANLTMMCLRHAIAWTDSRTCQDLAQYDEGGYFSHLTGWAAHRG
jgi:hypothetical protein